MAGPGKHCLCSFASLELTHKERTRPINNKQQHNHFCFGGHPAQDSKAGLDHQWEKGRAITTVAALSGHKFKGEGARSGPLPLPYMPFLKSGPISALVCINRSVIAYYNTIRAKGMREGKMLSANVE